MTLPAVVLPTVTLPMVVLLCVIPLAASVLLALVGGTLSRHLAPRLAAPMLTLLALATSLATGMVLCLAAFSTLARLPMVAAAGGWTQMTWRPWDQMPPGWGVLAAGLAAVLVLAACGYLFRAARDLARASRACRRLAPGHDGLVIIRDEQPTAYSVPAKAGAIVVSTGMLTLLDAQERRALLAHEAAHLCHHHARYVAVAELAAAANPLLRPLARGVRLAVELWADQVAAQEVGDSRAVARALARASLAASGRGAGTGDGREPRRGASVSLAIAQTDVSVRVHALVDRPPRQHRWAIVVAAALTVLSSCAAGAVTWAAHQQIEAAQLAYARAHADPRGAAHAWQRAAAPDQLVEGTPW